MAGRLFFAHLVCGFTAGVAFLQDELQTPINIRLVLIPRESRQRNPSIIVRSQNARINPLPFPRVEPLRFILPIRRDTGDLRRRAILLEIQEKQVLLSRPCTISLPDTGLLLTRSARLDKLCTGNQLLVLPAFGHNKVPQMPHLPR